MLAQTPDIGPVPADFVKYFMMMTAFLAALGGGIVMGRRGTKGSPLHVEQPVSVDANVSHAPVYAQKIDLDAVKSDIERRTRENLRQHEDSAKQLATVIEAGNQRQLTILNALAEMEQRMTRSYLDELKDIHQRLNPISDQTASNKTAIEGIQDRLQHLWEMIQSLWSHVFRKAAPRS